MHESSANSCLRIAGFGYGDDMRILEPGRRRARRWSAVLSLWLVALAVAVLLILGLVFR